MAVLSLTVEMVFIRFARSAYLYVHGGKRNKKEGVHQKDEIESTKKERRSPFVREIKVELSKLSCGERYTIVWEGHKKNKMRKRDKKERKKITC